MEALLDKTDLFTRRQSEMQEKRISVSSKRQITIPMSFFNMLGIKDEVECYVKDNSLIIKPVREEDSGYFAEEILKDLVKQGYKDDALIEAFSQQNRKMRGAVKSLINEADRVASDKSVTETDIGSLFSDGE
jgi:bifunctional DNA-binding transcriptional regulator/antitoxin component of YhaV-PrlF toxin-antitoxin module